LLAHVGPTAGTRSLSHAHGFAALALAPEGSRVGVDIEHLDPRRDCLRLARFAFAPVEAAQIEAIEDRARPERFYALWTLKEACIKALGLSLLEGLRRCIFTVTDGEWRGELPASIPWKAHLYRPRPTLYLAVVVTPGANEWSQYEWPDGAAPTWPLLAALKCGNFG
jgi:phosphopantetheinyl transferase